MKQTIFALLFIFSLTSFSQARGDDEVFLFDLALKDGKLVLSNYENMTNNEGYDNQPSFIDNNSLFCSSSRNGQTDILKYDIEKKRKKWISATEGSEYSPIKIPKRNRASAIRLEKDGTQKLYKYNLKKNVSKLLIDDLVIAYHTWYDENTIVSSAIENNELVLYITDVRTNEHKKVATKVGRSLHKIPKTNLVSYISKENEQWEIRSLNPETLETKFIAYALKGSEDICWTLRGSLLTGKGPIVYTLDPKTDKKWSVVTSLKKYGIDNITRLALSPNGSKMALVGYKVAPGSIKETIADDTPTLAPTLANAAWIAGNWKGEAFRGIVEENWSEPSGDSMMGAFKLINEGKVTFYEIIIIREVEDSLLLQLKHFEGDLKGWETKDQTVDFPLKKITPTEVIFDGMIFEKTGEKEMVIYVDIEDDHGKINTVKFEYTKD